MALDDTEVTQLTELLQKIEPDELPLPIFLQFARVYVTSIIELVPLRANGDIVEVLLLEREVTDPIWGGLLHTPGTVVRPNDAETGLDGALERLIAAELPGLKAIGPITYVTTLIHQVKRGTECANVFYVYVKEVNVGKWQDVTRLPSNLVDSQRAFIYKAAKQFNNNLQIGADL